ncbi:HTH-type transcriptional activator RhaS [Paenibacillus solanacearum]|uniref:HTH-type transcriptional activator RhaS n=2 Tax=Paenibacillus solanacearum TaxID=2048548 RepID=A0A916JWP2_9BACL|nr:HTH-type transcriptional activator RhaS [Paenibacillus solanacearum]
MHMENVAYFQYGHARWIGHGPMTKPYHLFMFVDKGSLAYRVEGVRYMLQQGDVLYMRQGAERIGEAVTEEAHSKYSAQWAGDGLFGHFPHLADCGAMVFRPASLYAYLKQTYAQMYQLWMRKDAYYEPLCQGMLLELMARVHQDLTAKQYTGKQARVVRQARDYILQYYREPLSIDELSHLTGRGPSYLITSFKKHYGVTPLEYMHRTRISKAEELLLETDFNMETIAAELGYCDASYFNRMFKKIAGLTPSAVRRRSIPSSVSELSLHSLPADPTTPESG